MPKALCITGMAIAGLLLTIFLLDLLIPFVVSKDLIWLAPFKGASMMMDLVFAICAGVLGFLSYLTFKEQI